MLYGKKIAPCCAYCQHATILNEDRAICKRNGVVSVKFKCRKYIYDPIKRIPQKPIRINKDSYSERDFSLD